MASEEEVLCLTLVAPHLTKYLSWFPLPPASTARPTFTRVTYFGKGPVPVPSKLLPRLSARSTSCDELA
jgi:hypothetical protein